MTATLVFALVAPGVAMPTGHYSLSEIAAQLNGHGLQVTVRASEQDRVYALRMVDVDPLEAIKAVVAASGNLELREERGDTPRYVVQVDTKRQAELDATAKRVFEELDRIYRKNLTAMHEIAAIVCAMKIEERQPMARLLQNEYDLYYEQWNKDHTNKELRKRLQELEIPLFAHTVAGEVWGAYPVEALWLVQNQMPRSVKDLQNWTLAWSEMPGGVARIQTLQKLVPEGYAVSDVLSESRLGMSDDLIEYAPIVFLFTARGVERTIHLINGAVRLQDCGRPDLTYHFEQKCDHYVESQGIAVPDKSPVGSEVKVTYKDVGLTVRELSRAAMLWADSANKNFVCELVPSAELLADEFHEGQSVSLVDIASRAKRWRLSEQSGVYVLDCKTRCIEVLGAPIRAAKDAGMLPWRNVPRVPMPSVHDVIKYAKAAMKQGGRWNPRSRRNFTSTYYGIAGFQFEEMALNGALADLVGVVDREGRVKPGTFNFVSLSKPALRKVFDYALGSMGSEEARHPELFAQFANDAFTLSPVRGRTWWRMGIEHKPENPLLRGEYSGTLVISPEGD